MSHNRSRKILRRPSCHAGPSRPPHVTSSSWRNQRRTHAWRRCTRFFSVFNVPVFCLILLFLMDYSVYDHSHMIRVIIQR